MSSFNYQVEKLNLARRCLMLPHTLGEAQSIAEALINCDAAFDDLDREALDDDARSWVQRITEAMDYEGLEDSASEGMFHVKAETLDDDARRTLSDAIDELASWFEGRYWEDAGKRNAVS